jgi:hypothetical protein
MSDLVTDLESLLKRISTKVKITVLCSELLTAVAIVLDSERRSVCLVEDIDFSEADLNVTGRHLRVLALALDHLTGNLKYPLATKAGSCLEKSSVSVSVNYELSDAIAVTEVNECHTS